MSTTAPAPAAPAAPEASADPAPEGEVETPPEKAETDWKALARKHEDRAKAEKKRADENEAAARRLADIENSGKSEAEKAQQRAADAEAKLAEVEMRALRAEVAADKGVPADLLSGSTREEIEAVADRLIEFRGAKPTVGVHLPNQDKSPQKTTSGLAETAKKIFGGQ